MIVNRKELEIKIKMAIEPVTKALANAKSTVVPTIVISSDGSVDFIYSEEFIKLEEACQNLINLRIRSVK